MKLKIKFFIIFLSVVTINTLIYADDADLITGYWNTDRGDREYWYFHPDLTVTFGRKETDIGWIGKWTLCGNKLIIIAVPNEFSVGEDLNLEITLTVLDHDKIIFDFSDGSREVLSRNYDLI